MKQTNFHQTIEIKDAIISNRRMFIKISRPDFTSSKDWEFRFGEQLLKANIVDYIWMSDFKAGKFALKHGDILEVEVKTTHSYDKNNILVSWEHLITKVIKLHHNQKSGSTGWEMSHYTGYATYDTEQWIHLADKPGMKKATITVDIPKRLIKKKPVKPKIKAKSKLKKKPNANK